MQIGFDALLPHDPESPGLSEQKRVISALIDGIRVLNLYVPNGSSLKSEKYPYKLEWLACLARYLEIQAQQGDPLCMVGDFNIGLESRDLPDPERLTGGIMASPAEREALKAAQRCVQGVRARQRPLELVGLPQRGLGQGSGLAHRPHLPLPRAARLRHRLRDPQGHQGQ